MCRDHLRQAFAIALITAFGPAANAQFEQSDNVLGAGIGFGGAYSGYGVSGDVDQTPALALHYDHNMGMLGPGEWGLGGFLGYKYVSYTYPDLNYTYDYSWTYFIIGARGSWHYNDWHTDKLDTYGGLMLAYNAVGYTDHTDYGPYGDPGIYSYDGSYVGMSFFLGARYYFSDKIGAYAELGYGVAALQLGVAIKF